MRAFSGRGGVRGHKKMIGSVRSHAPKIVFVLIFSSMIWYARRHENDRMADRHREQVELMAARLEAMERRHAVDRVMRVRDQPAPAEVSVRFENERSHRLNLGSAREKLAKARATQERQHEVPGDCSMIFSINTGRTGSAYLAHVLSFAADELSVHHEAEPDMSGRPLREAKAWGLEATYHSRFMRKAPALRKALVEADGRTYVETSHLFAKSFYDVVMTEFFERRKCDVRVIVLRRRAEDIAFSLDRLNFDEALDDWYYLPGDRIAALRPIAMNSTEERVAGYLYDVEAQVARFRRRYSDAPMIEVELEQIASARGVRRLYATLDLDQDALPESDAELDAKLKPVNTKGSKRPGVHAATAEQEEAVRRRVIDGLISFRQKYAAKYGEREIPELPSLAAG